ncbi:MAG: SMC-Scp complex subunit ScpB [Cyclobacteriaceae bacterium]|nr:SMC-Scp complex subunit ScpB [Cyclobacteriaceae bacterium]MCH8514919.1 SMC-Scp complex subunit ScpB [Cyclobacteriaceae bacterium]
MDFLVNHIEALIFCSPKPITIDEMVKVMEEMFEAEIPADDVRQAVDTLIGKFKVDDFAFEIVHIGGGYQFLTKPAYQTSIGLHLKQQSKKRLSTSALETLSIIAYKQPITKSEAEAIRGVSCDYAIQKLLEKELIVIKGKSDAIGRPLLYATSDKFMEYFGINSLQELPSPKDFAKEENQIGESQEEAD